MTVNYKELQKNCKLLFDVKLMTKYVGIKKNELVEDFLTAVEDAFDDKATVPAEAIEYYNSIVSALEEEEKEQEKEQVSTPKAETAPEAKTKPKAKVKVKAKVKAAPKIRVPKTNGVVAYACKRIKDNPGVTSKQILDGLETQFPDRPRKGMVSTVSHVTCIARQFLILFGIEVK